MNNKLVLLIISVALIGATTPYYSYNPAYGSCGDSTWRYYQADVVFEGKVTNIRELSDDRDPRTQIRFRVLDELKGHLGAGFRLTMPGRLDDGPYIPGMTLEWEDDATYRIEAREVNDEYELVCGELGRTLLESGKGCEEGPIAAHNRATNECLYYADSCQVPDGWNVVNSCRSYINPDTPRCSTTRLGNGNKVQICDPGAVEREPIVREPEIIPVAPVVVTPPTPTRLIIPRPFVIASTYYGGWR